jgi:hypothetical protein
MLMKAPTSLADGDHCMKPCAACINVSSPPLNRNTAFVVFPFFVVFNKARATSTPTPTQDAQSDAPGDPSVAS